MHMDVDILRSVMTVLSFVTFLAIVVWAWSEPARDRFHGAARLPFDEDESERSQ